jgi:hypothetical protein
MPQSRDSKMKLRIGAILGQMKLVKPLAKKAAALFGLSERGTRTKESMRVARAGRSGLTGPQDHAAARLRCHVPAASIQSWTGAIWKVEFWNAPKPMPEIAAAGRRRDQASAT